MSETTAAVYEIRVKGTLHSAQWAAQFDGMRIEQDAATGITTLTGEMQDQAALYGLLARLRNLALPLISVRRLDN